MYMKRDIVYVNMQKYGTSQAVMEQAYAASRAAKSQLPFGSKPFLVSSDAGPIVSARSGYKVNTMPLGFHKSLSTEQVHGWLYTSSACFCPQCVYA